MTTITFFTTLTIIFFILVKICEKICPNKENLRLNLMISYVGSLIITTVLVIILLVFACAGLYELKTMPTKHEELVFHAELSKNILYDEELIRDILTYNDEIRQNKKIHSNPWINFLAPIDLSSLELIDLAQFVNSD